MLHPFIEDFSGTPFLGGARFEWISVLGRVAERGGAAVRSRKWLFGVVRLDNDGKWEEFLGDLFGGRI